VTTPNGIILIDKPKGRSSMHVCANVRARLRKGGAPKRIKVGHAGTLDPMATGLLVVMVGAATRRCAELMADEKEYETLIDLAHRSTTDDAEGEITPVGVGPIDEPRVREVCARFVGVISQRPPDFSAIHVGGRRAYAIAREGKPVQIAPRDVFVKAIDVLEYAWPLLRVRVTCGKGVYIRSLARDVGASLGAGGMLRELRRTRAGALRVEDAKQLDDLPAAMTQADLTSESEPRHGDGGGANGPSVGEG